MRQDTLPVSSGALGGVVTNARPVAAALAALRARSECAGWCRLPFFSDGQADRIAAELDRLCHEGVPLAPPPSLVFRALELTRLEHVKAVILGQDPYPKAGDAHGLAFSYVGPKALPASLRVVFRELCDDVGCPAPRAGDLTKWAEEGVLLLNAALSTEIGRSGHHMKLGWSSLVDQVVAAVSAERPAVAFLLWGANARSRAPLIDPAKHLVIESGHPSPLNRARDFPGSRPFSRANEWLARQGVEPVDWAL